MVQLGFDRMEKDDENSKNTLALGFDQLKYVDCGIHTGKGANSNYNICTFNTHEIEDW